MCAACAASFCTRDVLTAYQANFLLTGKGPMLVIGPYIVLERLGEGGMGQVFKARHRQTQMLVALKVIKPSRLARPNGLGRFFREVRAAACLDDPHVVRAFDADTAGDTHYFAMEYVHGTDLAKYVKSRGPLPIELACQFLAQAALGLQHIHEHGMVHRDIKPGNLMLALDEQPATVGFGAGGLAARAVPTLLKILDLGLARLTEDATAGAELNLTHEGTVIGTADYMAPEQARASREADIRSDIYALGCTFYFALTGQVPYPGGSAVEKILRHQSDEPPPLDQFRPYVPSLLAAVLKKMMAKAAADRFQTPAELAAALDPLVSEASSPPPLAVPISLAEQQTLADFGSGVTMTDTAVIDGPDKPSWQWRQPRVLAAVAIVAMGLALAALLLLLIKLRVVLF